MVCAISHLSNHWIIRFGSSHRSLGISFFVLTGSEQLGKVSHSLASVRGGQGKGTDPTSDGNPMGRTYLPVIVVVSGYLDLYFLVITELP